MHPGPISGRGFVASMGGAFASFYLSLAHLILISRMPNPSTIEERTRLLAVYRLSKVCIKRKSDHRDCGIEFWKLQQDRGVAAPRIHRWLVAKVGFCNRSGVRLSLGATGCAEESKCHRDIVGNHRFFRMIGLARSTRLWTSWYSNRQSFIMSERTAAFA